MITDVAQSSVGNYFRFDIASMCGHERVRFHLCICVYVNLILEAVEVVSEMHFRGLRKLSAIPND